MIFIDPGVILHGSSIHACFHQLCALPIISTQMPLLRHSSYGFPSLRDGGRKRNFHMPRLHPHFSITLSIPSYVCVELMSGFSVWKVIQNISI